MKLRVTNPDGSLVYVDVSIQTLVVMMMLGVSLATIHPTNVNVTNITFPLHIEVYTPGGIFTETLDREDVE